MTAKVISEICLTNKGKEKIKYNSFFYRIDKIAKEKIYWSCIFKDKKTIPCKARIITSLKKMDHYVLLDDSNSKHCHLENEGYDNITKKITELVSQNCFDKTCCIANKLHVNIPSIDDLPLDRQLKDRINYYKRKLHPREPSTLADIKFDHGAFGMADNENFVLFKSSNNEVIVFGTMRNLERLVCSSSWMCDGTFQIVPKLFKQLFSIFGCIHNKYYPLIFALMIGKSTDLYEILFQAILNLSVENNFPISDHIEVMMDFELASANAIKTIIPNVSIKRCLFHLSQCLYRKIQEIGLSTVYMEDEVVRQRLRMLPALSFVKIEEVKEAFNLIKEGSNDDMLPIFNYFDKVFVHGRYKYTTRSGIKVFEDPLFLPSEWNNSSTIGTFSPRTSNIIESWHNRLRVLCHESHINFWELIDILYHETTKIEHNMQQFLINGAQETIKASTKKSNQNIALLFDKYISGNY